MQLITSVTSKRGGALLLIVDIFTRLSEAYGHWDFVASILEWLYH